MEGVGPELLAAPSVYIDDPGSRKNEDTRIPDSRRNHIVCIDRLEWAGVRSGQHAVQRPG
jgi:hypothetical protein